MPFAKVLLGQRFQEQRCAVGLQCQFQLVASDGALQHFFLLVLRAARLRSAKMERIRKSYQSMFAMSDISAMNISGRADPWLGSRRANRGCVWPHALVGRADPERVPAEATPVAT